MSKRPASVLGPDAAAGNVDHIDKKRGLENASALSAGGMAGSEAEDGAVADLAFGLPTFNDAMTPGANSASHALRSQNLAQSRIPTKTETSNGEQRAKESKRKKLQHIGNITGACSMLKSMARWFFDERVKLEEQQKLRRDVRAPAPVLQKRAPSPSSSSSGASQRTQGAASQRSQASPSSHQAPSLAGSQKSQTPPGPHNSLSQAPSQNSQRSTSPPPLPLNPSVLLTCTRYLTSLKRWNRQVLEAARESKASSAEARESVDLVQLELQNLRYECWHYAREIDKCESFKSKYQDVELVPEEEFLANAPPELVATTDSHKRMLNRLKYEMMERIRLEQEKGNQLSLSMKLTKENREKRAAIENIEKELEGVYQNILSVQGRLKLDVTGISTQEKTLSTPEK